MSPGQSRGARVARGLGMAVASVVIAAFSHVAAGGAAPGGLGTGLAFAFAALVCIGLAGSRLSIVRTSVAVVLSQLVFHVLFSLGAAIPTAHGRSVSMLGMVMSGGTSTALPDLSSPHAAAALETAGTVMWAGHTLAAAATIALLLHGERGLFSVLRLASARLRLILAWVAVVLAQPLPTLARRHVAAAIADRSGVRPLDVLLSSRPHRGPPRVA